MIKAVIYDLDDTMVDSDPIHREAWDILLERYGRKFSDLPEEFRAGLIGRRLIDVSQMLVKEFELEVDPYRFFRERSDIFIGLVKRKLETMPGLLYSIWLLRDSGMRLAIASSGTREYIDVVIERFKLHGYFDVIVSGDDVKVGKPNPEVYIKACEKLGLPPSECLVLEDATLGIRAAKSAGCKCIGLEAPNTPKQDRSEADLRLGSLHELRIETVRSLGRNRLKS